MTDMNKPFTLIIILTLIFLHAGTYDSSAERKNNRNIPYGDYCSHVSNYGTHHGKLTNNQVQIALNHYLGKKGLDFEIINGKGRFVKVLIKDNNKAVDTIIFDRNNGRIRSIK